eukprot:403371366
MSKQQDEAALKPHQNPPEISTSQLGNIIQDGQAQKQSMSLLSIQLEKQEEEHGVSGSGILPSGKSQQQSTFEKDKKDAQKLLLALKGDPDQPSAAKTVLGGMNQYKGQQKMLSSGEAQMDWFNFETRIRKVIYEVVEPLTRKQFQTFDGFDDIKKQIKSIEAKYDETLVRVDRVIKRNEAFDRLDKYTREIEQEILTTKALQKNDVQQILEKLETWGARWKVTQNDVNSFHKYDEKITKVQKSLQDVTEQYKQTVTQRFKDMSSDFMRQVVNVEQSNRDIKQEMQELMVKVQSVKDFTQNSDVKFMNLGALIDSLRETIENSRFTHTFAKQVSTDNAQSANDPLVQMQNELTLLRKDNQQMDSIIRPPKILDDKDIQRIVFQSQVEMYEKIFGQMGGLKKLQDYQGLTYNNYLEWRQNLIEKFDQEDQENDKEKGDQNQCTSRRGMRSSRPNRPVPFWKVYALEKHQSNNDLNRRLSITKLTKNKLSNSPQIRKASAFSPAQRKFSILQHADQISIINEYQMQLNSKDQLSQDQQEGFTQMQQNQSIKGGNQTLVPPLMLGDKMGKSSSIQQIQTNNQIADDQQLLNASQVNLFNNNMNNHIVNPSDSLNTQLELTARISNSSLSINQLSPQKSQLKLKSKNHSPQMKIVQNNTLYSSNDQQEQYANFEVKEFDVDHESDHGEETLEINEQHFTNGDYETESYDEEEFQLMLKKLHNHPSFVTQEKIVELVEMSAQFLNNKFNEQIQDLQTRCEIKFNQDKIYEQLTSMQSQQELINKEFKAIRNNEQITQLQNLINRTDSNIQFVQKDLSQQIYKLKDFDEQLYHKQIEFEEKLDLELIKLRRERSDQQINIDKLGKELNSLRHEDGLLQDQVSTLAEILGTVIEVLTIKIAVQQQKEIEKKSVMMNTGNNFNGQNVLSQSQVAINNQVYSKQHLLHCIRVLLESEWLSVTQKKPFKQMYLGPQTQQVDQPQITVIQAYNEQLNHKISKICLDFQQKLDLINQELERQNKGLPKEIQKIKESYEGKSLLQQQQINKQIRKKSVRKVDLTHSQRDVLNMSAVVLDTNNFNNDLLLDYGFQDINNHASSITNLQNQSHSPSHFKQQINKNNKLKSHTSKEQLQSINAMPEILITKKSRNIVGESNNVGYQSTYNEFALNTQQSPFSNQGKRMFDQHGQNLEVQLQSQFRSNSQLKKHTSIAASAVINNQINRSFNMNNTNNINLPRGKMPLKGSSLLNKQIPQTSQLLQQSNISISNNSGNTALPIQNLSQHNISLNNNSNSKKYQNNKALGIQQENSNFGFDSNDQSSLMLVPIRGNNATQHQQNANPSYNFNIRDEQQAQIAKKNSIIAHMNGIGQQMPQIQGRQQRNQL